MAYHGLLDWRLAADLLDLLRGQGFDPTERWSELGRSAIRTFAEAFKADEKDTAGFPAAVLGDTWLVAVHPFEEREEAALSEPLSAVVPGAVVSGAVMAATPGSKSGRGDLWRGLASAATWRAPDAGRSFVRRLGEDIE